MQIFTPAAWSVRDENLLILHESNLLQTMWKCLINNIFSLWKMIINLDKTQFRGCKNKHKQCRSSVLFVVILLNLTINERMREVTTCVTRKNEHHFTFPLIITTHAWFLPKCDQLEEPHFSGRRRKIIQETSNCASWAVRNYFNLIPVRYLDSPKA